MSHGKIEKFARMANQIGDYFAPQSPDEGAAGVASHVQKFWTPKMIAETLEAIDAGKISLNATGSRGFAILKRNLINAG